MENPQAALDRINSLEDPLERAIEIRKTETALAELQEELRPLRRAAVLELREQGWSYGEIGRALGLHRNRIQQIAEGRHR